MSGRAVYQRMLESTEKQLVEHMKDRDTLIDIAAAIVSASPVDYMVSKGHDRETSEMVVGKIQNGDSTIIQEGIDELAKEITLYEALRDQVKAKIDGLPTLLVTEGPPSFSREQMTRMLDSVRRADVPGILGLRDGPFTSKEETEMVVLTDGFRPKMPEIRDLSEPQNRHERRAAKAQARKRRR